VSASDANLIDGLSGTLDEARRILRDNGELRIYEHVIARRPVPRAPRRRQPSGHAHSGTATPRATR
jgi:hypothetical protein